MKRPGFHDKKLSEQDSRNFEAEYISPWHFFRQSSNKVCCQKPCAEIKVQMAWKTPYEGLKKKKKKPKPTQNLTWRQMFYNFLQFKRCFLKPFSHFSKLSKYKRKNCFQFSFTKPEWMSNNQQLHQNSFQCSRENNFQITHKVTQKNVQHFHPHVVIIQFTK